MSKNLGARLVMWAGIFHFLTPNACCDLVLSYSVRGSITGVEAAELASNQGLVVQEADFTRITSGEALSSNAMPQQGPTPAFIRTGPISTMRSLENWISVCRKAGGATLAVPFDSGMDWNMMAVRARDHRINLAAVIEPGGAHPVNEVIVADFLQRNNFPILLEPVSMAMHGLSLATMLENYSSRVIGIYLDDPWAREIGSLAEPILEPSIDFKKAFAVIRTTGWKGRFVLRISNLGEGDSARELVLRTKAFLQARSAGAGMHPQPDLADLPRLLPKLPPAGIPAEDHRGIYQSLESLEDRIQALRRLPDLHPNDTADIEIFHRMVLWALRYEASWSREDLATAEAALREGHARADLLENGCLPWKEKRGPVLRGHRSGIDDSAQLYGLILPADFDPEKTWPLDVVLHGRIRPTGAAMLRFGRWFQRSSPGVLHRQSGDDWIELYPLGRVTNGYRWAGEADVFEAIEAVCREYRIDPARIVLRGFSMGASGTWHIGLRHPDQFAALGPYMGYVDTRFFSSGPAPNLPRMGRLPWYQEILLPWIDAVSYSENAAHVPIVAAAGENDPGFRNHEYMADALAGKGVQLINLVARGTGHVIHPLTYRKQLELLRFYSEDHPAEIPSHLRFVTRSLSHSGSFWIEVLKMGQHYDPAEIEASADPGSIEIHHVTNIEAFAIRPCAPAGPKPLLHLQNQSFQIEWRDPVHSDDRWIFQKSEATWKGAPSWKEPDPIDTGGKSPGLQGPIDDAFTRPFLCVRGTGNAWNPAAASWAEAELRRFAENWTRYWVGDPPIINDVDLTPEDVRFKNLILFGDPGSNRVLASVLADLPLTWTREYLEMDGRRLSATRHVPLMIQPNPMPEGRNNYIVINSGHSFGEADLASVAYLLFPRRGDWAIMESVSSDRFKLNSAGLFGEDWRTVWKPAAP